MTTTITEFIDELQFGCLTVSVALMDEGDKRPIAEMAVDYLHTCQMELNVDDERRAVIDRMAAKIAAEGFNPNYGAYHNIP